MAEIDTERTLKHRQNGGYTLEEIEAGIVDPQEVRYMYKTEILVYEDQLPEMTDAEYADWFKKSQVIDGVRMGPPFKRESPSVFDLFIETLDEIEAKNSAVKGGLMGANLSTKDFSDGNGY